MLTFTLTSKKITMVDKGTEITFKSPDFEDSSKITEILDKNILFPDDNSIIMIKTGDYIAVLISSEFKYFKPDSKLGDEYLTRYSKDILSWGVPFLTKNDFVYRSSLVLGKLISKNGNFKNRVTTLLKQIKQVLEPGVYKFDIAIKKSLAYIVVSSSTLKFGNQGSYDGRKVTFRSFLHHGSALVENTTNGEVLIVDTNKVQWEG